MTNIIIIIIIIIKRIYTRRQKAEVTRRRSFNQSNKCVFSCALNCSRSSTARSAAGKLFQTRGPVTANDLSPSHVLVFGTVQVTEAAERSRRVSSLTKLQSSTRYGGAKLFNALNTSVAILNSTRRRTGSQCNSRI